MHGAIPSATGLVLLIALAGTALGPTDLGVMPEETTPILSDAWRVIHTNHLRHDESIGGNQSVLILSDGDLYIDGDINLDYPADLMIQSWGNVTLNGTITTEDGRPVPLRADRLAAALSEALTTFLEGNPPQQVTLDPGAIMNAYEEGGHPAVIQYFLAAGAPWVGWGVPHVRGNAADILHGQNGGNAGTVTIQAHRPLSHITINGGIATGDGGDAPTGAVPQITNPNEGVLLFGGDGGDGGDITLAAHYVHIQPGAIDAGDGGMAGSTLEMFRQLMAADPTAELHHVVVGGTGGDGGRLFMPEVIEYDWNGEGEGAGGEAGPDEVIDYNTFGGFAAASSGPNKAPEDTPGAPGDPGASRGHASHHGENGGPGCPPAGGQPLTITGLTGGTGGDGQEGGDGHDQTLLTPTPANGQKGGDGGEGGAGQDILVTGGNGGDNTCWDIPNSVPGSTRRTGGPGGNAQAISGQGGDGGNGANGGKGGDHCIPEVSTETRGGPPGERGFGGPGGHAQAQGGYGGSGTPRGADGTTHANDKGLGGNAWPGDWGPHGGLQPALTCLGL